MKLNSVTSKTSILFIEDDADSRLLFEMVISPLGHEIFSAENLDDALRYIKRGLKPQLVVSDLCVPGAGRNGEIIPILQESLKDASCPIVLASANHDLKSIAEREHAFGFVQKPYDFQNLIDVVKAGIQLSQAKPVVDDVLQRVKLSTRPQHIRVEEALDIMRADLSKEAYQELLGIFHGLYANAEAHLKEQLSPQVQQELQLKERLKTSLIEKDLENLATDVPQKSSENQFAQMTKLAEVLGLAYVLEGATLGGRMILPHLQSVLPASAKGAVHFYGAYGSEVGKRWTDFQKLVRNYVLSDEDKELFCEAAGRTFDHFYRALQTWSHAKSLASAKA